ncbi:unnamed protein product [Closterium sp. Naga37s-1]|nr:unnamed protein product [Closterium sp. Naga37s-1]
MPHRARCGAGTLLPHRPLPRSRSFPPRVHVCALSGLTDSGTVHVSPNSPSLRLSLVPLLSPSRFPLPLPQCTLHVWALTGLTDCGTVQQLANQASSATFPRFGRYRAYQVAEQPAPARLNESWRSLPLALMALHAPLGALPLQSTVEAERYPIPDSACGLPAGQAGKTPPPTHFVSHFSVAGVRFAVVGVYMLLGVSFRGSLPCAIREAQAVAMARVVRRLLLRGEEVVVMGTFNDLDGDLSADLDVENLDPVSRVMQIIKDATSERLINVAAALPSEKRQIAAQQTNFILISQHLTDAISVEMPHVKGMPYNPVILKLRLQQRQYHSLPTPPHSPSRTPPAIVIQKPVPGSNSSQINTSDGTSDGSSGNEGSSNSSGSSRNATRADGSHLNFTTTNITTTSNSSSSAGAAGTSSNSTLTSDSTSANSSASAPTTAAAAAADSADSSSRVGAGENGAAGGDNGSGESSSQESAGLSGGAVAAIVFFVIIGLAIGAAAAFWWLGGAKLLQKESFKRKGMSMFVVGAGKHWKLGKKKGHGGGGGIGGDGDGGSESGELAKEEGVGYSGEDSGKDGEAAGVKPKKKSFMSGYKVWKPMDASRFVPSRPVMAPPFQSFLTSQPGSPIIDNPVPLSRRASSTLSAWVGQMAQSCPGDRGNNWPTMDHGKQYHSPLSGTNCVSRFASRCPCPPAFPNRHLSLPCLAPFPFACLSLPQWHPDVNKDAGAAAMFVDVNRAYEAAVQAHEKASKAKPQRPARRKDDFDEFWDDFLGGKSSAPKADPRRKRQGMKQGPGGGGERMRDPLAWSPQPRVVLPPPPYLRAADVAAERAAFESRVDRAVRTLEEGRSAQAEGRWEDALALYTEVQEEYPDLALSVYGKAGRALMEYQVGDLRTAVTRLRVLSVEFKGYPEVHAALAAALYVEGGAAAAERQFTIATLLDSRFSNRAWLESERHWPPTLLLHMKRFLLLQ